MSVNSIDFKPVATTNLTEFNDINTIAEYISEIVLGKTNTFPEFAKKTQKQSQLQKHLSLKLFNTQSFVEPPSLVLARIQFGASLKESYLFEFYKEINPPPPKA